LRPVNTGIFIGGYRFSDFMRMAPLDLLVLALTVALAPVAFPF